MSRFSEDDEEFRFFDALEQIVQESDLVSESPAAQNWEYNVWTSVPQSVGERRREFIQRMGLIPDINEGRNSIDSDEQNSVDSYDRITENSGAVLRTPSPSLSPSPSPSIEDDFSSSRSSSISSCNNVDLPNERLPKVRVCGGFDRRKPSGEFGNSSQSTPSGLKKIRQRETEFSNTTPKILDKVKEKMLNKWRSIVCMVSSNVKDEDNVGFDSFAQPQDSKRIRRVRVSHNRRKVKELSALFLGQDIQAHDGSILVMKFSQDGQYLASAGVDKIVKIWQVVEGEKLGTVDLPEADPSCVYFSVSHLSELTPLMVEKDKHKGLKRTPDSACVIFPPKVFRIVETPLHVFEGHSEEILDLSWSKNNCLISSSVDTTVRLWRVGFDQCLKVFLHTDYVTCVQFNPVNDDCFISGSIDGKVRMWSINGCQVVDWTETKDIVTAVSYRPDGQGGIIGSITGTCSFFNVSDNHFQIESQMCLANKKKSPCKRITGFQFLPQDPTKIMVSCADSHVKIIDGIHVVGKYKGSRNAGNNISASLTSDGKHIVSASEDSNIYVWNYNTNEENSSPKVVNSFESFACDASVAITWSGLKPNTHTDSSINSLPFSPSSTCFSLSQEFPLDSNSKGSATWPEEKLPKSSPRALTSSLGKSQIKLFKTSCQSSLNSNSWGLVIVTAGWDGRIRSFHNYGLPVPL